MLWCKQCLASSVSLYWSLLNICFRWHLLFLCSQNSNCHNEATKLVHLFLVHMQYFAWKTTVIHQTLFIWANFHFSYYECIDLCRCNNVKNAGGNFWVHFNAIIAKPYKSFHFLEKRPIRYTYYKGFPKYVQLFSVHTFSNSFSFCTVF